MWFNPFALLFVVGFILLFIFSLIVSNWFAILMGLVFIGSLLFYDSYRKEQKKLMQNEQDEDAGEVDTPDDFKKF